MKPFVIAMLATVVLSGAALAQGSPVSLTVGAGGGWAGTTCSGCIASNENGPAGLVQIAASVAPALRLGVEWNGWTRSQWGERGRLDFVMAVAELYPARGEPFFVKGSAGYGHMRYHLADYYGGAPDTAEQGALAYGLGLGYDIPVGRHATVVPSAQVLTTRPGNGRVGRFDVEHQSMGMIQYGVSVRLH